MIDNKFYRILYFAEPKDFRNETNTKTIEKMISSFQIVGSNDKQTTDSTQGWQHYNNTEIEIDYLPYWGVQEFQQGRILFYSPIKFYFMGTGYTTLIDEPSSYDGPTDFVAKAVWWHKFPDRKWAKITEEASNNGPTRTLDEENDFKELFKKKDNWEAYAFIPIDLRTINTPDQFLMVFLSGATYVKNGFLCELYQSTPTVSYPPPKLSILPLVNSASIGQFEEKVIEIRVQSFSDIPHNITFKKPESTIIDATFSRSEMQIPPSGWNTTQLSIKTKYSPGWSRTETIPIVADTSPIIEGGRYFTFENKEVNAPFSRAASSTIEGSSLTIEALSLPDYIRHLISALSTPVSVLVPLAGIVGGIIAWFLKRETDKKGKKKEDKKKADELSKLVKLKEQGIITEDEFVRMKNNLIGKG